MQDPIAKASIKVALYCMYKANIVSSLSSRHHLPLALLAEFQCWPGLRQCPGQDNHQHLLLHDGKCDWNVPLLHGVRQEQETKHGACVGFCHLMSCGYHAVAFAIQVSPVL